MNSRQLDSETSSDEGPTAFRLRRVNPLPFMDQEEICPIIKQYFDFLENALTTRADTDISLLQEMLQEIANLLHSGKSLLREDSYLRMLDRLTSIYARGLKVENDYAFAGTAAHFAHIIETVSQNFHDYDYTLSVSLLLHYMDKLFQAGEESWLEIYEHLLCMPETLQVMQHLRLEHLSEISHWIEEGVDNLYTLRDEQLDIIDIQEQSLRDLHRQIRARQFQLRHQSGRHGITDISVARKRREIDRLNHQRQHLMQDRLAKLDIVDLLETNIREFSDRLARMRRSTLLKLVWTHPKPH